MREGLKGLMGKKVLGSREASGGGHAAVSGLILGVMGFLQLLCGEYPAGDPREQQVAWGTLRPAKLHVTAALQQRHLDDRGQGMAIPQGAMPRAGQTAPGALQAQSQVRLVGTRDVTRRWSNTAGQCGDKCHQLRTGKPGPAAGWSNSQPCEEELQEQLIPHYKLSPLQHKGTTKKKLKEGRREFFGYQVGRPLCPDCDLA